MRNFPVVFCITLLPEAPQLLKIIYPSWWFLQLFRDMSMGLAQRLMRAFHFVKSGYSSYFSMEDLMLPKSLIGVVR